MTILDRVQAWWLGRSDRERLLLGGLGIVLAALIGWYGIVTPLGRAAALVDAQRQEAESGLALAKAAAGRSAGRPSAGSSRSLAAIVDASAAAVGIAIERRREDADGSLTVWIPSVQPGLLMQWILALRTGQGVAVSALVVSRADASSLEVEIALSRKPG